VSRASFAAREKGITLESSVDRRLGLLRADPDA
jgi:hypothetical protein